MLPIFTNNKNYFSGILFSLLFFIFISSNILFAQSNLPQAFNCLTIDTLTPDPYDGMPKTGEVKLVMVYFDFYDGRIQPGNIIPTTPEQLAQVNIESVSRVGWTKDVNNIWSKKIMKYTYRDTWDREFSVGNYYGSRHPDNADYGDDIAYGYGSLREWFSEMSFNQLQLVPGVTWPNRSDSLYKMGIVNDTMVVNDNICLKPIMLSNNKAYYQGLGDIGMCSAIRDEGTLILRSLFAANEIEFDIDSYVNSPDNKVIFLFAGVSGNATYEGNITVGFEKRGINSTHDNACLEGLVLDAHEMGHSIGFRHSNAASYCVMTPSGKFNHFDCPQHPNIVYKLQAGWIDNSRITNISTNYNLSNLPPSFDNGDCAVITIYGKPGYDNNWKDHSEYIVIENRRKRGFDKWISPLPNQQVIPPAPASFDGGCLVWKYSAYKGYSQTICNDAELKVKLISPTGYDNFQCGNQSFGHSTHFFGVEYEVNNPDKYDLFDSSMSHSSFDLPTGIEINNINGTYSDTTLSFNVNYRRGEPPVYSSVFVGQTVTSNPVTLSGNVFMGTKIAASFSSKNIVINPGTNIDFIDNYLFFEKGYFKASGDTRNSVQFRGVGYDNFRVNWKGVTIFQNNANPNDTILFKYCNFTNLYNQTTGIDVNVNNNYLPVSIENTNFNDTSISLNLTGTKTNDRAVLSKFNNNNINKIFTKFRWRFDLENDFTIPINTTLFIFNKGTEEEEANFEFSTPNKIVIDGKALIKGSLTLNRDFDVTNTGSCNFYANDDINQPTVLTTKFQSGYGINCSGLFSAVSVYDSLIFTVNGAGNWNGINCQDGGNFILDNVKVRNAETGVTISNPLGSVDIQNSRFSENQVHDILIDNLPQNNVSTRLVKNNIFTGNPNKLSGLTCSNGVNILIESNQFDNDYSNGISLLYMTDPNLISNVFAATLTSGYTPYGIYAFSSAGFYSCNNITNYSSGMRLNNSSPFLYNNDIYYNGTGLYVENTSNPILTPAFSPGGTLYTGGYNRIYNNLDEEIYVDNNSLTFGLSLPVLDYGQNSIYDQNSDCLINAGNVNGTPVTYNIRDNFWGGGSPENRLCGSNIIFVYEPYLLGEPEPPASCVPFMEISDNSSMSPSTLLLGGAIIDDFNGNSGSAVEKYKDLIDPVNNMQYSFLALSKIFYSVSKDNDPDFYSLENYYSSLSALYHLDTVFSRRSSGNSTLSDVEQPSYPEAIGEYQAVIDNPLNETERHYAYIDQLRTIRLMLDSLLNGLDNGAMNNGINELHLKTVSEKILNYKIFSKEIKGSKSENSGNSLDKSAKNSSLISTVTENDKNAQLSKIRKSLYLENINFTNLSNKERIKILDNLIAYKLFEISILSDAHNSRPLDRMNYQKKSKVITNNLPVVFKLHQNYPNPFNPLSTIKYDIPKQSQVTIKIFDIIGREVATLVNETKEPGFYNVSFDGTNYSSGVYFYRIEAGTFSNVKKMVLLK